LGMAGKPAEALARMPSTIHNAQTGEHITFLPRQGDVLRMSFVIDGGGLVAAEHFHPGGSTTPAVRTHTQPPRRGKARSSAPAVRLIAVPCWIYLRGDEDPITCEDPADVVMQRIESAEPATFIHFGLALIHRFAVRVRPSVEVK